MKKFIAIPTWVLTNALVLIVPKNHVWKNKWFTLDEWSTNQTDTCKILDMFLWYSIAMIILFSLSHRGGLT